MRLAYSVALLTLASDAIARGGSCYGSGCIVGALPALLLLAFLALCKVVDLIEWIRRKRK